MKKKWSHPPLLPTWQKQYLTFQEKSVKKTRSSQDAPRQPNFFFKFVVLLWKCFHPWYFSFNISVSTFNSVKNVRFLSSVLVSLCIADFNFRWGLPIEAPTWLKRENFRLLTLYGGQMVLKTQKPQKAHQWPLLTLHPKFWPFRSLGLGCRLFNASEKTG